MANFTKWVKRLIRAPFALLHAIDLAFFLAFLVAILAFALLGPAYLARDFFGSWLAAGAIVVITLWLTVVSLVARAVWRGDAGLSTVAIF